ncbi:MAG TPA: S8 family serine peptidase, partial [Candidatus Saccharimonadales bacterium]|nr:S8 family serine peptidase [Candidatus Saccharimonadales bacterium]
TFRAFLRDGSQAEIDSLRAEGVRLRGHEGRVVTFDAPLRDARAIASLPAVRYLDLGRRYEPELDVSVPATGADKVHDAVSGYGNGGAGVLVATLDTGQDLKHMDFRHADKTTRFKSVWNMDPFCGPKPPPGHSLGCYYTEDKINKKLKNHTGIKYKDFAALGGHGTHVMGIAASNGLATRTGFPTGVYVGMAPEADLIGVQLFDGSGNFVGDITEGLQFLGEEQARLGDPPLVVNISLGHQFGAHDGSDPDEAAIDAFVQDGITNGTPRVVVKSAGNNGGEPIYVTGTVAQGGSASQTFTIPATTSSGGSCGFFSGPGNDIVFADLWYEGDATVTVRVTAPDGATFQENTTGNDPNNAYFDTSFGSIFVDCPSTTNPVNGDRECAVGVDDTGGTAPLPGKWTVRVSGVSVPTSGRFDAWLALTSVGICSAGWDNASPGGTISIPGTAQDVLAVGAFITKNEWTNFKGKTFHYDPNVIESTLGEIASFSAQGPTRDGRIKPDLAAPGMGIASARARTVKPVKGTETRLRTVEDKKHMILEGTSMAAPHVTGAAALLLSLDPTLDAATIGDLLRGNATADTFTGGALPDNTWGAGKLDVFAAAVDRLGPP